jgi:Fe-S-cluster containining protein
MKDGAVRRVVKRVALWNFLLGLSLHRAIEQRRGRIPHDLGGECRRCARCCEAPGIQVGWAIWYLPLLRRLFLWWQERVNGFVLTGRERAGRVFIFRCTHFDWTTRSCDSYDSRPGMCRDYPRVLLAQASPEFLPGCGYRAVAAGADRLVRALERASVTREQMARLKKDLRLER